MKRNEAMKLKDSPWVAMYGTEEPPIFKNINVKYPIPEADEHQEDPLGIAFVEWVVFSSDVTHHMNSQTDFWYRLLDMESNVCYSTEELFKYWIKNIYNK